MISTTQALKLADDWDKGLGNSQMSTMIRDLVRERDAALSGWATATESFEVIQNHPRVQEFFDTYDTLLDQIIAALDSGVKRHLQVPKKGDTRTPEEKKRDTAKRHEQRFKERDEMFRKTAYHSGLPWTQEQLDIALDYNLTRAQAARRLNRTMSAIKGVRRKYGDN